MSELCKCSLNLGAVLIVKLVLLLFLGQRTQACFYFNSANQDPLLPGKSFKSLWPSSQHRTVSIPLYFSAPNSQTHLQGEGRRWWNYSVLPQMLRFAGNAVADLLEIQPAPWRPSGEIWKHSFLLLLPQPAKEQKWKWQGNADHSGGNPALQ